MSNLFRIQWVLGVALAGALAVGQNPCPAAVSDDPNSGAAISAAAGTIFINEILASNNTDSVDPQGQLDDWIELYNPGSAAVDVAGMYLTDDTNEPTRWQFPPGYPELTTIAAQGFLLLWADGDTADAGLHANFKLSADGETVALYDRDGVTLVDSVSFGQQTPDVSYGRYPDGAAAWLPMLLTTPGDKNVRIYQGAVAEPQFSRPRGFYDSTFTLELTTPTEGAAIYYRLDGADPLSGTVRSTVSGTKYTGPITISRTTCVRAAAIKADWMYSPTVTATYIFLDDVIHQPAYPAGFPTNWGSTVVDYAMDSRVVNDPTYAPTIKDDLKTIPSVSVVLSKTDFFDAQKGIYANLQAHGLAWERAASLEWIDPVRKTDFQVNAGLRIHGSQYGRSASVGKHSLRILFKNEYGPSTLKYPLFEDSDVDEFDNLVLRGIWNYSWFGDSTACGGLGTSHADYLRDLYSRDTIRDMGRLNPRGRPVHVYINGLYWGLYILSERPDEGFASIHLGGTDEDYDILYANGAMETVAGDQTAWNALLTLASADLSKANAYEAIQKVLDVPAMIDYLLMIYYVGSRDAPVLLCNDQQPRNFYTLRSRNPAGPFVFLPWDVEWTLESPTENRVNIVGQANPHYFLNRLKANADFRMLLADRIYQQFFYDGPLTTEQGTARYLARATEIDRAIIGESARWGDERRPSAPYTRTDWIAERDRLVNQYFSGRTATVLNQLRQAGLYPAVSPPDFMVNGKAQRGGHAAAGSTIALSAAGGTIWYTLDGSDPRPPGSTASATSDSLTWVAENAAKKVLVPTGPVSDAWKTDTAFDDASWTSGTGGVGFERSTGYETYFKIDVGNQMYGKNETCYIRIPFSVSVSLAEIVSLTLKVRYDDAFVAYLNGQEVQRARFTGTPAWDSGATSNHDDAASVQLETFDLSAHLGTLQQGTNLLAIQGLNQGRTSSDFLISVELTASKAAADLPPSGISPSAIRYAGPFLLNASAHLKTRVLSGSTWSALNEATFAVGPVAESLRVSELMYHPAPTGDVNDPNTEYLELTNIGTQTINLNLVRFADGIDFTFPSFELAPAGYCLVVKDLGAFYRKYSPTLPVVGQYTGSLSNAGERIELQDAAGRVILQFEYRDSWFSKTDGGGFSLTVKDPVTTDPNALSGASAWKASSQAGGTPGAADQP
jgi:hypothetical protein